LNYVRQLIEAVNIAAPEHDVIGDEGELELGDSKNHFGFPFILAQSINPWDAKEVFDFFVFAIGKIAEFEREKHFVQDQGRTESGAEPEKEHSAAVVTPQRLHCGVIDHVHRFAERGFEIEADPARPQMFWFLNDFPAPDYRGEAY